MEIFRSYFYNAKTNKKRSTAGIIAYILLFAALMIGLGGMFTELSVSLCAPLTQAGMGWLYFALMSLLAIFLGAFGSVFNTYSGLYFAKDNDLLLSLPIPVRTLMASRLLTVYLMGLMYSAVVILPAVIVYWVTVSAAPMLLDGRLRLEDEEIVDGKPRERDDDRDEALVLELTAHLRHDPAQRAREREHED